MFAAAASEAKTIYETALRQVENFEQLAQVDDRLSQSYASTLMITPVTQEYSRQSKMALEVVPVSHRSPG